MTDIRRVQQSGNSLLVTLPEHIIRHLHLAKGNCVEIDLIDTRDGSTPFVKLWKAPDNAKPAKKAKAPMNEVSA